MYRSYWETHCWIHFPHCRLLVWAVWKTPFNSVENVFHTVDTVFHTVDTVFHTVDSTCALGRALPSVLLTFNKKFDFFWHRFAQAGNRTRDAWVEVECPIQYTMAVGWWKLLFWVFYILLSKYFSIAWFKHYKHDHILCTYILILLLKIFATQKFSIIK